MTIQDKKQIIEKHKAFKHYFKYTGECYESALELWIPEFYDLVEVTSEEEAQKLIEELINLNE